MRKELLMAASFLCCATYSMANTVEEDPRLRPMLKNPVVTTESDTSGAMGPGEGRQMGPGYQHPQQALAVGVSFYCSKDTAKKIGVTIPMVRGVSVKIFDQEGSLVAQDDDAIRAAQRRDGILNFKKVDLSIQQQMPEGQFYAALCDVEQHSSCYIPPKRASDPLDKDDGKDSIAIVGFVQNMQVRQGFMSQQGQAKVLFDLPSGKKQHRSQGVTQQQKQSKDDCDDIDSPLIIDLGNDGIALSGLAQAVPFDLNADGVKEMVAWPTSSDDAFVALDKNKNGMIDNGDELLGNNSEGPDGQLSANGFISLAKYDSNKDGKIDAADPVFADLLLWSDANRNGISEKGELESARASGLDSIQTDYVERIETDMFGNEIRQRSIAKVKGEVRIVVDAWLRNI